MKTYPTTLYVGWPLGGRWVAVGWPLGGRWVGFCPPKRAKAINLYHLESEDFLPPIFFRSITLPSKSNQKDDPIEMAIPLINQPITR